MRTTTGSTWFSPRPVPEVEGPCHPARALAPTFSKGATRLSTVSVVIPCYRYGDYLPASVRSALDNQPGVDVRVLIIDDASPDDSADKAHALAASDDRIEVWVHEQNRGHIATYNEGLLEWAD